LPHIFFLAPTQTIGQIAFISLPLYICLTNIYDRFIFKVG
jgi:hypothetical protein